MLWLRNTFFDPNKGPVTAVVPEDGLRQEIHVAATEARSLFGRNADVEIFEWDGDVISASMEAEKRARTRIPEYVHLKNTLHDFLVSNFFLVKPSTVIMTTRRAPLSTEDMKAVALEAMKSPHYRNHTARLISMTGDEVVLGNGGILVRDA